MRVLATTSLGRSRSLTGCAILIRVGIRIGGSVAEVNGGFCTQRIGGSDEKKPGGTTWGILGGREVIVRQRVFKQSPHAERDTRQTAGSRTARKCARSRMISTIRRRRNGARVT